MGDTERIVFYVQWTRFNEFLQEQQQTKRAEWATKKWKTQKDDIDTEGRTKNVYIDRKVGLNLNFFNIFDYGH